MFGFFKTLFANGFIPASIITGSLSQSVNKAVRPMGGRQSGSVGTGDTYSLGPWAVAGVGRSEGWGPAQCRPPASCIEILGKSLRVQGRWRGDQKLSREAVELRDLWGVTDISSEPLILLS